jgi:hypothetical protein
VRPVASTLFVVVCEPPPEHVAEFNRWYDEVHGPDALENGSFHKMRRYHAVGPGYCPAHYVNLWDGDYQSEAEAWAYIHPRAEELKRRGRITDGISGVIWATMMLNVPTEGDGRADTSTLTTVQSDWRFPNEITDPRVWLTQTGLDDVMAREGTHLSHACFTGDPDGKGGGRHLALFETEGTVDDAAAAFAGVGEPGISPTPPYQTIFVSPPGGAEETAPDDGLYGGPPQAVAWTMHWELITGLTA